MTRPFGSALLIIICFVLFSVNSCYRPKYTELFERKYFGVNCRGENEDSPSLLNIDIHNKYENELTYASVVHYSVRMHGLEWDYFPTDTALSCQNVFFNLPVNPKNPGRSYFHHWYRRSELICSIKKEEHVSLKVEFDICISNSDYLIAAPKIRSPWLDSINSLYNAYFVLSPTNDTIKLDFPFLLFQVTESGIGEEITQEFLVKYPENLFIESEQ